MTPSASAKFQHEGADECHASDGDGEGNREVAVGVAHVGLHTGDQAVGDHSHDAEQQAKAHASGGEKEGGEEHANRGSKQKPRCCWDASRRRC